MGVGIPALQQTIDRTSFSYVLNVPAWGERGLPFIAGLLSAGLTGVWALLTNGSISTDRFALAVLISMMGSELIGLIEPRTLEPAFRVWILFPCTSVM